MGAEPVSLTFEGRAAHLVAAGPAAGPVVLFAHPFPLHGGAWEGMMSACASAGLRAAAVDVPGFGQTPARGRALTMDDFARLLAAALDALGAPAAALVGCSMGGYAVMAFARLFPHRVSEAVLMNTKAAADTAEGAAKREGQARLALAQGPRAVTDGLVEKLGAPGLAEREPKLYAYVAELAAGATAQGLADALRGMALRPDSSASLKAWTWPTLVVAGELDQLMARADLEALAEAVPGAKLEVIAGAGHLPMLEKAAETEGAVVRFLGG